MDLAALHIFRTVVSEGGIARAAGKLNRVQSNVSTRVKQLEESLGVELFIREKKRLILSPAGRVLLDYADRLLRLAGEARLALASGEPAGRLAIGSMESTAASRLPAVLSLFHREHPLVRIEMSTGTTLELIRGVLAYELDAALVADPVEDESLHALPVFSEELVLVTPRDHAPVKTARDVAEETLVAFRVGCAYRKRLDAWFAESDVVPRQVLELGSYHAILACVAAGTGIAALPHSVLDAQRRRRDFGIHRLPARHSGSRTILIWRRNADSPALRAFAQAFTR